MRCLLNLIFHDSSFERYLQKIRKKSLVLLEKPIRPQTHQQILGKIQKNQQLHPPLRRTFQEPVSET